MKKLISIILALAMVFGLCSVVYAGSKGASISPQKLTVNDRSIDCEKYNIYDYNYFKLRDIAKLLSGTASQFEVGWDEDSQTISITTGQPYTEVGGELSQRGDYSKSAKLSSQTVMINGSVVSDLSVYNIGNNNFFKLRDLGTALGFDVDYQSDTDTAEIFSADYSISPKRQFNSLLSAVWQTRQGKNLDLETLGAQYVPKDESAASAITKEEAALLKANSGGKEVITPEEAKADIDLLFRAMHATYSAYYYFGVEKWKTAESNIMAWIDTQTEVKSSELKSVLREETKFMVDGHSWLGIPWRTAFGTYQSFIAFDYEFDKDGSGYYTTINNDKYYITDLPDGVSVERTLFESGRIAYAPVTHAYENKMADTELTLKTAAGKTRNIKLKWTVLNPYNKKQSGPDFSFEKDSGVAYISLRSFAESAYPDIFAQFEASGNEVKDCKLIIFDLRANGGGDGYSLINWGHNFLGKDLAPNVFRYHRITRLRSTSAPERFYSTYQKMSEAHVMAPENNIPVIVLVDNHTASAGEYAAQVLRQINNAVVIGSNTQGNKIAGATTSAWLPNSGIPCEIGTHFRFVNDFTNHDILGDNPDVWANPYTVTKSLINMLKYYELPQSETINNILKTK